MELVTMGVRQTVLNFSALSYPVVVRSIDSIAPYSTITRKKIALATYMAILRWSFFFFF